MRSPESDLLDWSHELIDVFVLRRVVERIGALVRLVKQ